MSYVKEVRHRGQCLSSRALFLSLRAQRGNLFPSSRAERGDLFPSSRAERGDLLFYDNEL